MNDKIAIDKREKESLFIQIDLWLIIANITKPTKGVRLTGFR